MGILLDRQERKIGEQERTIGEQQLTIGGLRAQGQLYTSPDSNDGRLTTTIQFTDFPMKLSAASTF
jgi:hypothetical protein